MILHRSLYSARVRPRVESSSVVPRALALLLVYRYVRNVYGFYRFCDAAAQSSIPVYQHAGRVFSMLMIASTLSGGRLSNDSFPIHLDACVSVSNL